MEEYYLHQPPHVKPQCMGCGAPKRMWHDVCKYCEGRYAVRVQMNHHLRDTQFPVQPKKWVLVLQVIWDNLFIIIFAIVLIAGLITSIISQC